MGPGDARHQTSSPHYPHAPHNVVRLIPGASNSTPPRGSHVEHHTRARWRRRSASWSRGLGAPARARLGVRDPIVAPHRTSAGRIAPRARSARGSRDPERTRERLRADSALAGPAVRSSARRASGDSISERPGAADTRRRRWQRERLDILAAVAQRQEGDRHHAQAVIEVLAKRPSRVSRWGRGCGRDDARLAAARRSPRRARRCAPEAPAAASPERQREVADLVEEQGPRARQLEPALAIAHRARERAAERGRESSDSAARRAKARPQLTATNGCERRGEVTVQGSRHQLLAGARSRPVISTVASLSDSSGEGRRGGAWRRAADHAGEQRRGGAVGDRGVGAGARHDEVGHARVAERGVHTPHRRGAEREHAGARPAASATPPALAALAAASARRKRALRAEQLFAQHLSPGRPRTGPRQPARRWQSRSPRRAPTRKSWSRTDAGPRRRPRQPKRPLTGVTKCRAETRATSRGRGRVVRLGGDESCWQSTPSGRGTPEPGRSRWPAPARPSTFTLASDATVGGNLRIDRPDGSA